MKKPWQSDMPCSVPTPKRIARRLRDQMPGAVMLLAAVLCVSGLAGGAGSAPTLQSIGDKVYCLCGCVTTLNHCPHLPSECSSRAQMEGMIHKGISQGKDETAIIQDLVLRYGVQVQATPPARGFNLTVWILPGVGLVAGLLVVLLMVRRWARRLSVPADAPSKAVDPKLVAAVEQEIDRVLGGSKPA